MKQLPDIKFRLISGFSIAGLLFAAVFLLPDAGIPVILTLLGIALSLEFYKLESAAGIPTFNLLGTLATVALVVVAWWTGVHAPATAGSWDAVVIFVTTIAVLLRQFPQKNNPQPFQKPLFRYQEVGVRGQFGLIGHGGQEPQQFPVWYDSDNL